MHGHTCISYIHISYVLYFIYDYDYDTLSYIHTLGTAKGEKRKRKE